MRSDKSIDQAISKAIRALEVPGPLQEEARQEGWVVAMNNERILPALRKWYKKETGYLDRSRDGEKEIKREIALGRIYTTGI